MLSSANLAFIFGRPWNSTRSENMILTKILEDEVVSSSFILMTSKADQGSASVPNK